MDTPTVKNSDRNKLIAIGFGALLLVVILAYALSKEPRTNHTNEPSLDTTENTSNDPENTTTSTSPTTDTGDPSTNRISPTTVKPKTTKPLATYEKALESYQYKFQFVNCTAIPAKLTFKQGVKVMLDNRDQFARTIGIGNTKYTIQAYDFVIVTAPAAGNYALTCGGKTVGEVKTQK